ncbi:splicing regulator SDE2-like [Ruditapes philippinarum]|uniref:splicing regulator SDE2-like n=1 Tax=Ruditapes philippinarum TaxID=129788 RepID=UPI00295B9D95|nr:splicing regulator SDE2-like [Ruditapes philippinarum]
MTTFVHSFSSRHVLCLDHAHFKTVGDLKSYLTTDKGFPKDGSFFVCNGSIVKDSEPVQKNAVYHTHLRLPGGKGGFGSMLRAIGAQIEKTTNHEACRDLSGRRMRDVNNEKDLKEWLGKQAEREREREEKRQERLARRRAMPNHKFDDPLYDQQRSLLAENQEDALQTGLKKFIGKQGASATVTSDEMQGVKRKPEEQGASGSGTSKKKKDVEWLGVDIDNISDLDSDEETFNSSDSGQNNMVPGLHKGDQSINKGSDSEQSETFKLSNDAQNSVENDTMSSNNASDISDINQCKDTGVKNNISDTTSQSEPSAECEQEEKPLCLEDVANVKDLEAFGLDRLKQELMSRGLKCGGTLEQRAQRLFSVKGLTKDQIDSDLFAKSANGKKVKNRK